MDTRSTLPAFCLREKAPVEDTGEVGQGVRCSAGPERVYLHRRSSLCGF